MLQVFSCHLKIPTVELSQISNFQRKIIQAISMTKDTNDTEVFKAEFLSSIVIGFPETQ